MLTLETYYSIPPEPLTVQNADLEFPALYVVDEHEQPHLKHLSSPLAVAYAASLEHIQAIGTTLSPSYNLLEGTLPSGLTSFIVSPPSQYARSLFM